MDSFEFDPEASISDTLTTAKEYRVLYLADLLIDTTRSLSYALVKHTLGYLDVIRGESPFLESIDSWRFLRTHTAPYSNLLEKDSSDTNTDF